MTNTTFIETSAHKRFVEFARTVRKDRTIGLCYGPAGVGKTLSARRYAKWDIAEPLLESWGPRDPSDEKVYAALARSRTVFYTPPVASAFAALRKDLNQLRNRVEACIDQALDPRSAQPTRPREGHTELIIVDEAERLTNSALEYLRDQFDRAEIGLILIGMPGIEKRMSRYPQLYSRIGFAHPYPPLSRDEMDFILKKQWQKLGKEFDADDFADVQAAATISRLTGGNFRLLQRLFNQIDRILHINELREITDDVIQAAASTLVIGTAN